VKPKLDSIALPLVFSLDGNHPMEVLFAQKKVSVKDAVAILAALGVSWFTKMVREILQMQNTNIKQRLATSIAATSHAGPAGILLMADFGTRRQEVVS
jgi:hypothetical protein